MREKILQERIHDGSKIVIVIEDYKLTKKVGVAHPVPVEVIPFSHENTRRGMLLFKSFALYMFIYISVHFLI
jgi:ribose 5-phosphate isomerase